MFYLTIYIANITYLPCHKGDMRMFLFISCARLSMS